MSDPKQQQILAIVFVVVMIIAIIVIIIVLIRYKPSSDTSAAVTGCETVTAPTNLTAISSNTTDILVRYSEVTKAVKYVIYLGTIPAFTKGSSFAKYTTSDTEYTITGQILGRTYYVFVDAYNNCDTPGPSSTTVSIKTGYPSRFRITSQQQPSLSMAVSSDLQSITLQNNCSGIGSNNKCAFNYDGIGFHTDNDSSNCVKTVSNNIQLKYGACNDFSSNYVARRTWTYNASNGSFCNDSTSEGILCAKIYGNAVNGQLVVKNSFDDSPGMKWSIVQI